MGSECFAFHANEYKNSINVGIWVFVSMISFMLGQVEHELGFFRLRTWVVGSFVFVAFCLCLDRVVEYADWSHSICSCDLGRNVVAYCNCYGKTVRRQGVTLMAMLCH